MNTNPSSSTDDSLCVVMPAYNEAGGIEAVISQWLDTLRHEGIVFRLHVINDGSTDSTPAILDHMAKANPELCVTHKPNSGHGPSVLAAYKACAMANGGMPAWIFQTDADDEISASFFPEIWRKRQGHDLILGIRAGREQNWSRRLTSAGSRLAIRLLYGKGVTDVNIPFRLMRRESFANAIEKLPADTIAPNVLLSGYACARHLRIFEMPVGHQNRRFGQTTLKSARLLLTALKAFWQTAQGRFRLE